MLVVSLVLCIFAFSTTITPATAVSSPIKHIIVLMMENRSFDHLLGWLHQQHPEVEGLTGNEHNFFKASDPKSKKVFVNHNGFDRSPDDPGHSYPDTAVEIYGHHIGEHHEEPKMNGFVQDAVEKKHSPENPMSMFNATTAPIINTLALEFGVFDHWFCSVPGPTSPNRQFAMSGTSFGVLSNFNGTLFSQQSYFDFLRVKGRSFKGYYQDDPWAIMHFADMHKHENKKDVHELDQFYIDVKNGHLPDFTWLQPRMTSKHGPPTWQHPDALISEGERLIKTIYEALRKSPLWNSLAFVITYDEHGGFYDHVAPPQTGIPNPDGRKASNGFNFDRLGIRIPTIVVSPWVAKGKVIHHPKRGGPHFDATSVIATTNRIFNVPGNMTRRDAWVGTFEDIFEELPAPRTDCPLKLPNLPAYSKTEMKLQHQLPLNDHLEEQIEFYCIHNNHGPDCGEGITNQYEASEFIVEEAKKFMQK